MDCVSKFAMEVTEKVFKKTKEKELQSGRKSVTRTMI